MIRISKLSAAFLLCVGVTACGDYHLSQQEQGVAELGARNWAERTNSDYVGCSGLDSDRDSYVTCTVKDKQTNNREDILCSYKTQGCKRKQPAKG